MNLKQFSKLFPLGSHLCREPMPPMREMKKDMEMLKNKGFNLIKLQEHWMLDEPEEGKFDFSKYEELIEYAARLDLGIYLGLTCEQAPRWLYEKYPDCRMVGQNGLPVYYEAQSTLPGDGKPGPCFDHPGAMAAQERFIKKLVKTLGAYENLVVWNVWQEIGYRGESLLKTPVCYCENTIKFFKKWLKEKYGDIDELNRAWNTRYVNWDHVLPQRDETAIPQVIDWKYFMNNIQIAEGLKRRVKAIKEADSLRRPVFAHKGAPLLGSGADWSYARALDFLGTSTYPAWGNSVYWDDIALGGSPDRHSALLHEMWERVSLRFDYLRSCDKKRGKIWAAEFQGGPGCSVFVKGRTPSPEDIRRWILASVASGMTGISFWVTRAEIMAVEANGFSLLDSDGDTSERLEEVSHIGKCLNEHADIFAQPILENNSAVGIIIDEENYSLCSSAKSEKGNGHLPYSVRGWHRLLWDEGIPVDFVEASELDEAYIRKYKALILPFPISISESVVEKLIKYVENGGSLISEACIGRFNEHAFCNRGELSPGIQKLFNIKQSNFKMVREPKEGKRWTREEETWGEYLDSSFLLGDGPLKGTKVRANAYIETFDNNECKPCLKYGDSVAGVVKNAGKGKAWLLGTIVGHNGMAYKNKESREFALALLDKCQISPEHQGRLLLRKRTAKNKEAWIFINPTPNDITEEINVKGKTNIKHLLGGSVKYKNNCVLLTVKSLDVKVLVLESA